MKPADLEKLRLQPGYDDIRRGWIFGEQRGGQKGRPSLVGTVCPFGASRIRSSNSGPTGSAG